MQILNIWLCPAAHCRDIWSLSWPLEEIRNLIHVGCLIDQTNESSEQVAFILCATRSDDISDF